MRMRPKPKMLHRLPTILLSPHQHSITPRRCPQRKLIQRQTLPARLQDPSSRRSGEPQCRDTQFWESEKANVVCHGTDCHEGFVEDFALWLGARRCEFYEGGEGEGGAVDAGHEKAFEDYAVEVCVRTT